MKYFIYNCRKYNCVALFRRLMYRADKLRNVKHRKETEKERVRESERERGRERERVTREKQRER